MKILIHDYPGHAFPLQLSRNLAEKGHRIFHLFAGYNVTPRGDLTVKSTDPETFSLSPIYIQKPLEKYKFVTRWRQENEYGRLLAKQIQDIAPDVVISSNAPLDVQKKAFAAAKEEGIPFIFWLQDIISVATKAILEKRFSFFGKLIGEYYQAIEKRILRESDHIVSITDDFKPILRDWDVAAEISVIPNWAPIASLPVRPKNNSWAKKHNLDNKFNFIYTGTLGMKHNPELLFRLAEYYEEDRIVRVVVISEGLGADWLTEKKKSHGQENLVLLEFQPFEKLKDVMGTADVLLAILQKDAGVFSVPSKILSYFCAQRPVLAAFPRENLASRIITNHNAGLVVDPEDVAGFCASSMKIKDDRGLRQKMGKAGRNFAERYFDIDNISNKFLNVISHIA